MNYRYPRISLSPQPLASANQVSHVLYQHDVMDTWCNVFGSMDEYDNISGHILELLPQRKAVDVALREVLSFWFDEPSVSRRDLVAVIRDIRSVVEGGGVFRPFFFANTEFGPDVRTVASCGLLRTDQYLSLPRGFFDQSPSDQHTQAKDIIQKHMVNAEGRLGPLGAIRGYTLYRPNGYAFLYTKAGDPDVRANEITLVRRLIHPLDHKAAIARARTGPAQ